MPRLIFKQRVTKPTAANKGKNAARHIRYMATREGVAHNVDYIAYIARRSGAVLNEDKPFGLFGKFSGIDGDIPALKGALDYVKEKAECGTHIYRAILSVTAEDAAKLGLDKRKGWEELLRKQLHVIAKGMDIPLERMEWLASVHMEQGHPHVHLDYWDSDQGVRNYFVPAEKSNDIRQALTRAIFAEEMNPLYELRKEARDRVKGETKGVLGIVDAMLREEVPEKPATPEILHLRNVQKHLPTLTVQLNEILDALPETGALKQQYLPPDVKEKLRAFSVALAESNPQCRAAMEEYLDANVEISEMYSKNPERLEEARQTAADYVYKEIDNQVLAILRPILKEREKEGKREDEKPDAVAGRGAALSACDMTLQFLSSLRSGQEERQGRPLREERSKTARKEAALKNSSTSGLDWERG